MKDASRVRVLAILLVAYIFNFIDRQIVAILAVPIKADLGLSDTQLGLIGGLAFALFYTGLGIPIAWLADRWSRVKIIAAAVAVWSAFTALCGFAQNFWHLFLARMGVGVGEAGGVAPSYSLIADYFPPGQRARALAIFSFGIPIGSALGIYFGGWIATHVDWRAAFFFVGIAGLPIALLVRLGITEPVRGAFESTPTKAPDPAPPFSLVAATLAKKPSFWFLSFGAASSSILGYGLIFWLPSFFQRSFDLPLAQVSWFYGSIILIGGLVGVWFGGWLGDRLGNARASAYAIVPSVSFLFAAPAFAVGLFVPNATVAFFVFLVPTALAVVWVGPTITSIQQIVPPNMRSTASACILFINNLIGIGFGTVFFGFISDLLSRRMGDAALQYAMLYGLGFYLLAALLFLLASRHLQRDWYHPAEIG
jgi:MFS transporter, Spinster family, sphingosine-1-phosphate transporter